LTPKEQASEVKDNKPVELNKTKKFLRYQGNNQQN
jgi:hypothetical protein